MLENRALESRTVEDRNRGHGTLQKRTQNART